MKRHEYRPIEDQRGVTGCAACGNSQEYWAHSVDVLPDSGAREVFGDGLAVREADPTKPALGGISPYLELALGELMRKAGIKYAEAGGYRNWEKGMPVMRVIESIKRHVNAFQRGDESEDHLAAVAWNAMVLIHYRDAGTTTGKSFTDLDDRPRWSQGHGK